MVKCYSSRRTKNRAYIGPLVPLTFVLLYQADMAYGNKIDRIRGEIFIIVLYSLLEHYAQVKMAIYGAHTHVAN